MTARSLLRTLLALLVAAVSTNLAPAASPRFVAGPPWGNIYGVPMVWFTTEVRYSLDPGPLSSTVSHDAAQAMVDAAAQVWNTRFTAMNLQRGGPLDEDVSSSNVYLGSNGPIWPADMQASNFLQKNIAVVFDADGTITDMLLGSGASDAANCRQNAVTESVDGFAPQTLINHAIVFLNGRCAGPSEEQMLQMQYQLMRVFGRVLGIGWSQTNDNVFTGSPQPTYAQQMHWPVMHPIDIVCGLYTYQCMPQPFVLRPDDIAALSLLYPLNAAQADSFSAGTKEATLANAQSISGKLKFPDGSGMPGANLVIVRQPNYLAAETWETVSAVSGYLTRGDAGNPVSGAVTGFAAKQGGTDRDKAGDFFFARVPIDAQWFQTNFVITQTINPLYRGQYALGPYKVPVVPSGSPTTAVDSVGIRGGLVIPFDVVVPDAAIDCHSGEQSSEASPGTLNPTGLWTGKFCSYGHSDWVQLATRPGHSFTIEVTALDENSAATGRKALPMIGVWQAGDPLGTLPTLAASLSSLNGRLSGMTQLKSVVSSGGELRIALSEERGEGRPDFSYRARVLYADIAQPARMAASGGRFALVGFGFLPGNTVTIGGVAAVVESWSPTQIVAQAPAQSAVGAGALDVIVTDLATGATASIPGGLIYGSDAGDTLNVVAAPSGSIATGAPVAGGIAVQVRSSMGTPAALAGVSFSATVAGVAGGVDFGCGAVVCTVATDTNGMARISLTATQSGGVVVTASLPGAVSAAIGFVSVLQTRSLSPVKPVQYLAAGEPVLWSAAVEVGANGQPLAAQPVAWSSGAFSSTAFSDSGGIASLPQTANLLPGATTTATACAWTSVCAQITAHGVAPQEWNIVSASGTVQSLPSSQSLLAMNLRVVDLQGNAVVGVPVSILQTVTGWQPTCSQAGRCAVASVYGTSRASATSDSDGLVQIAPLQYANTAAITQIVAAAGPQGYFAASLEKQPWSSYLAAAP